MSAPPSYRLLAAFSLAHAGAVIGYLPLLSLLLPLRMARLAGEARIGEVFREIHLQLKQNTAEKAAAAVLSCLPHGARPLAASA